MKFQFPKLVIPEFLKLKNSSDAVINPATEEKQDAIIALTEMTVLLKSILGALQYSRNADMTNNSDRVTVVNTVATTVSAITTLTTLTNMLAMNSVDASIVPRMNEYAAWQLNVRSTIS